MESSTLPQVTARPLEAMHRTLTCPPTPVFNCNNSSSSNNSCNSSNNINTIDADQAPRPATPDPPPPVKSLVPSPRWSPRRESLPHHAPRRWTTSPEGARLTSPTMVTSQPSVLIWRIELNKFILTFFHTFLPFQFGLIPTPQQSLPTTPPHPSGLPSYPTGRHHLHRELMVLGLRQSLPREQQPLLHPSQKQELWLKTFRRSRLPWRVLHLQPGRRRWRSWRGWQQGWLWQRRNVILQWVRRARNGNGGMGRS